MFGTGGVQYSGNDGEEYGSAAAAYEIKAKYASAIISNEEYITDNEYVEESWTALEQKRFT